MTLNKSTKTNELVLPEGFSARPARLNDVQELTHLFNLVSMKISGASDFTANELGNDLKSPGLEIEKDTLVVCDSKNKIVAYQDMFALSSMPVHPIVWGRVHPDFMGLGLGTTLFKWGIERAKSVLDRVPEDVRVSILTWNNSTWQPGKEMLENLGLEVKRHYFEMEIEMSSAPPTPVWPDGIQVSTYQHPEEAEAVYRVVDESFEDHYGHVSEPFEEGFKRFQHFRFKDDGFNPDLWFLAKDGDEIAGISLCRKWSHESTDEGHVSILGVRRPWRKRGLGLALLQHSFNEYWKRNQKRVTLGVDASSITGAVDLYKRAGMHKIKQNDSYELELRPGREIARV